MEATKPQRKLSALMFADVKGYSALNEPQLDRFFRLVLPDVGLSLRKSEPYYVNTWGDAVVAAFDDSRAAANAALALRDLYAASDWTSLELPDLTLRCALHAGHVFTGHDPITGVEGIVGSQVVLAARVEPVIVPGHVWATDTFVALMKDEDVPHLAWDDLGERPLAKEWGAKRLFRLRRAQEPAELPSLAPSDGGAPETVGPLGICLRLVEVGTDEQRVNALDMLGRFDDPEALRALVSAAKSSTFSHEARRIAVASLQEVGNPAVTLDMLDVLRDPAAPSDLLVRVVELLGALGDARATGPLIEIAEADSPTVPSRMAEQALIALAYSDDSRAQDAIVRALASSTVSIARAAVAGLGASWARGVRSSLDPSAPLVELAGDRAKPVDMRGAAIEALVIIGARPEHEGIIATLAADSQEAASVRRSAMLYLSVLEAKPSQETLEGIAGNLADPLASTALVLMIRGSEMASELKKSMRKK